MVWIILIMAGLFEVGFTTCLVKAKETSGSTFLMWISGFFVSLSLGIYLLFRASKSLPMGTS